MQSPGLESLDQRAVRQDAVQTLCPQSIEIASFSGKSLNEKTKRRKTLKCSVSGCTGAAFPCISVCQK